MKKVLKKIICLLVLITLSVNTYAAVGSYDGSAFVTKAEFDALLEKFNQNMDSYENGLYSKIDSAIANYLSGLSDVVAREVYPIVNSTNGIWSCTTDGNSGPKPWVEGVMGFSFDVYSSRWTTSGSGGGAIIITANTSTGADFKEHIFRKIVTVSSVKYGEYYGYCSSSQDATIYGGSIGVGNMDVFTNTNPAYVGNFKWYVGNKPSGHFWVDRIAGSTDGWNCNISNGAATRTIKDELMNIVICTPTGISFPYFNIYATAGSNALWCQDPNVNSNGLHSTITNVKNMFSSISGKSRNSGNNEVSKTVNAMSTNNGWDASITGSTKLSGTKLVRTRPFLGFTKDVTDWKNVYTTAFDTHITELKNKNANIHTITESGKEHLLVTNGFPLVYAEKGDIVYIPVKFDKIGSAYKNIDIWLKATAFNRAEDVKTSTHADLIKPKISDCTNMVASTYANAITLNANAKSGQGQIKFTMPKSGYIFMKWSVAGNSCKGGGTFYPQKMMIQSKAAK